MNSQRTIKPQRQKGGWRPSLKEEKKHFTLTRDIAAAAAAAVVVVVLGDLWTGLQARRYVKRVGASGLGQFRPRQHEALDVNLPCLKQVAPARTVDYSTHHWARWSSSTSGNAWN